jgi:hypothetical protein
MCLGMTASGIVQFMKVPEQVDMIAHLGYPLYFLSFLAIMKFLGVITVLIPGFPLLKEWAYAGFFFTMLCALYSHIVLGDPFKETFPPILLLALIGISWYFRPANRKIIPAQTANV